MKEDWPKGLQIYDFYVDNGLRHSMNAAFYLGRDAIVYWYFIADPFGLQG